jgi:FAD/FMN-containing dehydrogenase
MIDRRPAEIVRARSVEDVRGAIADARSRSLSLAVRGGGHNVAGNGTVEGGLVLDLSTWNDVTVAAERRVVTASPGALLRDVDAATTPHGLAAPIGVVSGTGVAGLTLGGGVGWLTRAYGLTIDNLLAAEVVTAAGDVLRASPGENPELFWALRGGGGNFGVVTSFALKAYPLAPGFFAGNLVYGRPRWADALRAWRDWAADLPDALTAIASFLLPPPEWELGDEVVLLLGATWAGPDPADGRRLVDGLTAAAEPDVAALDETAWPAWQSAADELFPKGVHAYWKNASFDQLTDDLIETIVEHAGTLDWRRTGIDIHLMGGAFAAVPDDATAYPNRSARFLLNIYGTWDPDGPELDRARIGWVRGFHGAVQPFAASGQYVNFLGLDADGDPRAAALAAYGPAKLARLIELKRRFDPENVFRLNHNIDPAWSTADLPDAGPAPA